MYIINKMKFMHYFFEEINSFFLFLIFGFPGRTGVYLRRLILKILLKKVGKNLYIETGVVITNYKNIILKDNVRIMRNSSINADNGIVKIGNNVSINYNVNINCSGGGEIIIGDGVLIGQNTVIRSADHKYIPNVPFIESGHTHKNIIIEENVWIGANCCILKNSYIGNTTIIGANSTITKKIDSNKVVVGSNEIKKSI